MQDKQVFGDDGEGDGDGEGSGCQSGSGSTSQQASEWLPITVNMTATNLNQLARWDAARAAYAAAGDTVIIDGTTVAEGVAGRGFLRLVGLAGFLLMIEGQGPQFRPAPDMSILGTYTPSGPNPVDQTVYGDFDGTNFISFAVKTIHNTGINLTVNNGGTTDLTQKIWCQAEVSPIPVNQPQAGSVTFYAGDMVQTLPLGTTPGSPVGTVKCWFNGTDLGGAPSQSYTMTAVYSGIRGGSDDMYLKSESFIGVDII